MNCDPSGRFQRSIRNLLVFGVGGTAPDPGGSTALAQVIEALRRRGEGEGERLRILAGLGPGVPEEAAGLAGRMDLPLDIVAPCRVPGVEMQKLRATRLAWVSDTECEQPDAALEAAAREAALSLADAVILVGGPPAEGPGGESLTRVVAEAALRYTPTIHIGAKGQVALLDHGRLDDATLVTLAANGDATLPKEGVFRPVAGNLEEALDELVAPAWDGRHLAGLGRALNCAGADPGEAPTWRGMLHTWFFRLFGPWQRKGPGPVLPWRGPESYQEASQLPPQVWDWFDRVDRAATHSANQHRDDIVVIHLLAVLAVFGAVAGKIDWLSAGDSAWTLLELCALAGIGALVFMNARRRRRGVTSHDGWLHFRQAAEALRMSAILHPMLGSLVGLQRGVWGRKDGKPHLVKPYHWLVIQLLRDAGIPDQTAFSDREQHKRSLALALQALVKDQTDYHEAAAKRYGHSYHGLHRVTLGAFLLVCTMVGGHLVSLAVHALEHAHVHLPEFLLSFAHWSHAQAWPLLITAVFPALAAGLHGINTKAELHRLEKNSKRMVDRLKVFKTAIDRCADGGSAMTLRGIALQAAGAMYNEHDTWAELMADQELEIPA